jgi:hypothetical protein
MRGQWCWDVIDAVRRHGLAVLGDEVPPSPDEQVIAALDFEAGVR